MRSLGMEAGARESFVDWNSYFFPSNSECSPNERGKIAVDGGLVFVYASDEHPILIIQLKYFMAKGGHWLQLQRSVFVSGSGSGSGSK